MPVAGEGDRPDLDQRPFIDDEGKINPVFIKFDDLRVDDRRISASCLIDFQQALAGLERKPAGIDPARLDIDDLEQLFIIKGVIALDIHPVDDRVFDHLDAQNGPIDVNIDVREQLGLKKPFKRDAQRTT